MIFEMRDSVALDMWLAIRINVLRRLRANDVRICTSSTVLSINNGSVEYEEQKQGIKSQYFDSIVLAVGMKPFCPLKKELEDEGIKPHVIGDAKKPSRLHEALTSAVELAAKL